MTSYEFWRHLGTSEVWAVKLLDGIVVGCAGPLHHDDVDPEFLADLDYSRDRAGEIEGTRDEFAPLPDL